MWTAGLPQMVQRQNKLIKAEIHLFHMKNGYALFGTKTVVLIAQAGLFD